MGGIALFFSKMYFSVLFSFALVLYTVKLLLRYFDLKAQHRLMYSATCSISDMLLRSLICFIYIVCSICNGGDSFVSFTLLVPFVTEEGSFLAKESQLNVLEKFCFLIFFQALPSNWDFSISLNCPLTSIWLIELVLSTPFCNVNHVSNVCKNKRAKVK